jgi:putative peptidoglycan lipid II flippase
MATSNEGEGGEFPEHDTAAHHARSDGRSRSRVARGAGIIAIFTLVSRIAGFVRDQVIVHVFGASRLTDVFWTAFTIPNVMRRLVAEGAVSAALVPLYTEIRTKEGDESARTFLRASLGLVVVGVLALTLIGMASSRWLVWIFASGFAKDPATFELAVDLTRWLFPYVYLVSLVALSMGALNAHERYAASAASPILLNVGFIAATLFIPGHLFDPPIFVLVVGVLAGGAMQVALQIPAMKSAGLLVMPRIDLKLPAIRTLLIRLVPQLFGLAVYQLNIIVLRQFASYLPEGQITYYYNADRLMQFAYGIFAVSIAQAALPAMAEAEAKGDHRGLLATWRYATGLTNFVTIPAAVGLMAIALPLTSTFYFHGAYTWTDVLRTATTTLAFAPGLIAQGATRTTVQAFFALKDTKTPVWTSTASLVSVVVFGWLLLPYEVEGLSWALTLSTFVQLVLLYVMLGRTVKKVAPDVPLGMRKLTASIVKQTVLATLACAAAYAIARAGTWDAGFTVVNGGILMAALAAAMAIYGLGAMLLRFEELDVVMQKVRRRFKRR